MLLPPLAADWLVRPPAITATVQVSADKKTLTLENGLIRRTIRISPDAATVALTNLTSGEEFLRAVGPEATIALDGEELAVGGLLGQPNRAFLKPAWIDSLTPDPKALRFTGYSVGQTTPRFTGAPAPPGVSLALSFSNARASVTVHYELYDHLPVYSKWLTIKNISDAPFRLTSFQAERLSLVEGESVVDSAESWALPNLSAVTDYAFGGMAQVHSNRTIHFEAEPEYETQVNYEKKTPCRLIARPPLGPDVSLAPGESLGSFRVFLLLHDTTDRERKGLAVRKMQRVLIPWALDNPLLHHVTTTDPKIVREAIDQCAEVGFEMVILSFGSGLNMEDTSQANVQKFKELADYAHSKNIRLGGYSLLASRRIDDDNDVINPKTGKTGGAIFGNSPCLGSAWGIRYFENIRKFLSETGFDVLEHDGSYPGDFCASTTHPGHKGLADSQWTQFLQIQKLYRWCRAKGIYLNVPDYYFFNGSNKTGMGYRETNWSLPRAEQQLHTRQNLYDGTWEKTPSMGWMFVPLVQYHGGGPAATIEPMKDHLPDYERNLQNNLGFGAQACWRGPRLYDSPQTKALVSRWVAWYKLHREVLEGDVLHLRRADGRDWDGIVHINPTGKERAMAVLYNPLEEPITRTLRIPLRYANLDKSARMSLDNKRAKTVRLDSEQSVSVTVTIPAQGMTTVLFTEK